MAIEDLELNYLEAFALTHEFKLVIDPFHGSTAYEFQKKNARTAQCAGCLIGPEKSILYTRVLKNGKTVDYNEVREVSTANIESSLLCAFVLSKLS